MATRKPKTTPPFIVQYLDAIYAQNKTDIDRRVRATIDAYTLELLIRNKPKDTDSRRSPKNSKNSCRRPGS